MSSKFVRVALFLFVSVLAASKANAALIVGNLYTDAGGVEWEYVGSFDLAAGPAWDTPAAALTGLEAAALLFGGNLSDLATSAFVDNDTSGPGPLVTHTAWYDGYADAVRMYDEDENTELTSPNGLYDVFGDISAYVRDRADDLEYLNFVFKRPTEVSEPSILALFAVALLGLRARRFSKR